MAETVVFRRRMGGAARKRKVDQEQLPKPVDDDDDSGSESSGTDQERTNITTISSRIPKKRKHGMGLVESSKPPEDDDRQVVHGISHESASRTTNTSDATKQNNSYDEDTTKRRAGPIKPLASNVRSTMVTDYQPDVCKDYKQTGFCGYGDSCKFLHMREDYKAGWQLDREWEDVQNKKKKDDDDDKKQDQKQQDEIPFACVICKKPYNEPVVTNCKHYFCEACFLKRSRTNPTCIVCGENTSGSARPAKNVREMMAHRKS